MIFDAVIVAAGSGSRAGRAKQWAPLAGTPVVCWSVEALRAAGVRRLVVVVGGGDVDYARRLLSLFDCEVVEGGATRAQSVRAGLAALEADAPEAVLVHDAARPFLSPDVVSRLLAALEGADGAVPALPVADTLKRGDGEAVEATLPRDGLWRAQTPQAFRYARLIAAHEAWPAGPEMTDDAAAVEAAGGRVAMVAGDPRLMKLTYPEDFAMAEALAGQARRTRIGQGFDAHRFGPGASVWLCGIEIPHDRSLVGHSDADAGLHALTDAILGAMGEGDIGHYFPPSDPQWKGASSDRFLLYAAKVLGKKGGSIANVDITLICEQPKIGPHREAMRGRIAELLGLPLGAVSIKATTTEGMGFTGRGEGLAAQAIVAIELPV